MDAPEAGLPAHWAAAAAAGEEELLAELTLLEEMPQVAALSGNSLFDRAKPPGSKAQLRGAIVRVICCGKQVDMKCNDKSDTTACPTLLHAIRMLRVKVTDKHGSAACLEKARERSEAAAAPYSSEAPPAPASSGFARWCAQHAARRAAGGARRKGQWRTNGSLACC